MDNHNTVLEIKNLKIYYNISEGCVKAVDNVSLQLCRGDVLGLVGESGCGKTTLIKSLLKILPSNGYINGGTANYKGEDIFKMDNSRIQKLRWNEISIISQSAMNALDPIYRVGDQIVEAITEHEKVKKEKAYKRAEKLFDLVGVDRKRLKDYPHQYSGGMKQRAVIAMALALNPDIILADEPTTALDVVVQAQILQRINKLLENYHGSMIMATHDISVIAQTCNKVAVMYGGKILEFGDKRRIVTNPYHPYTLGLKNAFPSITGEKKSLISIPGNPPDLLVPPHGCIFAPRCPFVKEICKNKSPLPEKVEEGYVSCHRLEEVDKLRYYAEQEKTWLGNSI